jgi:glycosyltransferase involved in cell wall biosynthesis
MNQLNRIRLIAPDYLKYNQPARLIAGGLLGLLNSVGASRDSNSAAEKLLKLTFAARLCGRGRFSAAVERKIRSTLERWSSENFDWDKFFPDSKPKLVGRSIILKRPGSNGEKGVLFVAFEYNWLRLLRYANVKELARDYDLVLSPTWSPPHDLPFLVACRLWPSTLFTILSNFDDEPVFQRLASNVVTIPLLASSWVDPSVFESKQSQEKCFDVVVLSNFANYKRHFALFRALSKMHKKLSVLILGRKWGDRTQSDLEKEAKLFGVFDQITIAEGLPDDKMIGALQSGKVSVIMSMGEGACVAVSESLFADVPVAVIQGANIGSRAFINSKTGRFLRRNNIADDLEAFVSEFSAYSPRKWMLENKVSSLDSSRVLNDCLEKRAVSESRPWTKDVATMHWRPYPVFASATDRESMRMEYERFEFAYGVRIEPDVK